jgi:hypothetical protein
LKYNGQEVWSKLDADTLRKVAAATSSGRYIGVEPGTTLDLGEIYQELVASAQKRQLETATMITYDERFQIFLVAGILKMPRLKFILADAVSSVATISIMVGAGYWGGSTLEWIKKDVQEAQYALLILIMIIVLAVLLWRLAVKKLRQDTDIGED